MGGRTRRRRPASVAARTTGRRRSPAASRPARHDASQRRNLATDLQRQLRVVLADRVRRERGWDIVAHPELAYEALPPDLADLMTRPADLRLADVTYLSALLDRIESP